jgi:hypothetical protein
MRGEINHLRGQIDAKTADRFTGSMGLALENRILRLEDKVFFQ